MSNPADTALSGSPGIVFPEKSFVTSVGVRWALRAQIIATKNGDIGEIATLYG